MRMKNSNHSQKVCGRNIIGMCVLQCDHDIINMNNLSEQELVYVHVDIYIYRIIKHQSHHTRLFLARNACTYLFI